MITPTKLESNLAFEILSCSSVQDSLMNCNHACSKIVRWQESKIESLKLVKTFLGTPAQRPEPWAGHLNNAKIVFLASNPSFSVEEKYPTWEEEWSESTLRSFGSERFVESVKAPFGAIDKGVDADRTILKSGKLSPRVPYWREIRGRASEILGIPREEISARRDYVMTELVHCKSHNEFGVTEALKHCANRWLNRILELTQAQLLVVMGVKPAKQFLELFPDIPKSWGSWKNSKSSRGYWPTAKSLPIDLKTKRWSYEQQKMHTVEILIGGRTRKVIWLPRPNSSQVRKLSTPGLIDSRLFLYWREGL